LNNCYDDGFIGNLYDLQGQGVPLMFPMDQTQVVESITRQVEKLKFSERLYKHIDDLKAVTKSEIARGIANDYSYADIARNISRYSEASYKRAFTIAQTEGGRIYSEAKYHSQLKAQEMGADVYKQWDATRDSRTRPDHKALHGQLRKVDEPFEIGPYSAQHPLGFGVARLDIRCRCDTLQRAGWALDDDEIEKLKEQGDIADIEADSYEDFKMKFTEQSNKNGLIKSNNKLYSEKEIEEIAEKTDIIVSKHTKIESKWNGNVEVKRYKTDTGIRTKGYIETCSETSPFAFIHEHLHARSALYYDIDVYLSNIGTEESVVNFFAQEIAKIEGIVYRKSDYDDMCNSLRRINEILNIKDTDYEFAKTLFETPMENRLDSIYGVISANKEKLTVGEGAELNICIDMIKHYKLPEVK
jgi:SPP1 gp7 family putative phage head morphogenesis protein